MADEYINSTDRLLGATRFYDAVFTDKKENANVKPSDFLNLMIAQMRNQDFMNPMDDSQFVTQMAQFTTMQQMMELAEWSKSSYAMSLVGKTVTASKFNVSGGLDTTTGVIDRMSFVDNEYVLQIGDKKYSLSQIMEVHSGPPEAATDKTDKADEADKTDKPKEADEDKKTYAYDFDPSVYRIAAGEPTSDAAVVFWSTPADEVEAALLRYTVYFSETGPFDTLDEVEAGILSGQKDRADLQVDTVVGLNPGTDYYINVVVTDVNGEKAVYKPVMITTKALAGVTPPVLPPVAKGDGEEEEDEEPEGPEGVGAIPEEGEAAPADDLPEPEDPEYDGVYGADEDSI